MKNSLDSTKMITSGQVSGDIITDLDKFSLFPLNDNNNYSDGLNEIHKILILLSSKIKNYGTQLEVENKTWQNQCVLLETEVQNLSKPCVHCIKYKQDIDNLTSKNDNSNKVLFDSDADSRSSPSKNVQLNVDIPQIVKSLAGVKSQNDDKPALSPVKTPPSKRSDRERDTSPVVQKQLRSGKRSKLSLSVNKKYKFDKDDVKLNADLFSELPDIDDNDQQGTVVKSDPTENDTKNVVSGCITISDETVLSDSSIIEPSPTPIIKHRRSKKPNPFLDGKYNNAFECVNNDSTLTPVSVNILENRPASDALEKTNQDDKPKAKWDLKKQRDSSGKSSKLKQTTLSTVFSKKPVDISTSNGYKGGVANDLALNSIPEDMEITFVNNVYSGLSNNKENAPVKSHTYGETFQESLFYGDHTKKKKSSTPSNPSAKVNDIFSSVIKSNDKNKKLKTERDASQETIFNEDEPVKEKLFPVTKPNTALQETFFQIDKPNDNVKRNTEVNTALQETFFVPPRNDSNANSPELMKKRAIPLAESNAKLKNDTHVDTSFQETFFNPAITSTVNQLEPEKKTTPKKTKPKPVELPKNSFDFLPSPDTPKYKYRRDALRKKADRQKLPGWECPTCAQFYLEDKEKFGETQLELIRKCSRHRDKYPIKSNTPPGIWNPKFDTSDESD